MSTQLEGSLVEHLRRAGEAEFGTALAATSAEHALSLRRRLYFERERLRRRGMADFEDLSFLIQERGGAHEVWIVRRDKVMRTGEYRYPERPLSLEELPLRIRARGHHRPFWLGILEDFRKF